MPNAQVTIDVGARLQILQSSVSDIQKVLDKLEPNTTSFKRLSAIVNTIRNDMERLQAQSSKGFISQSQFSQTERTIDKIETSLNRTKIVIDNLKFKDIKLTPEQEQSFKNLEREIGNIEKAYISAKDQIKQKLFSNEDTKLTLINFDQNILNKDLDAIEKIVTQKVGRINGEIAVLTKAIATYQSALGAASGRNELANKVHEQGISTETVSKDIIDKFLKMDGGQITGIKRGMREQFIAALTEAWSLDEETARKLANKTFTEMQKAFTSEKTKDKYLPGIDTEDIKEKLEKAVSTKENKEHELSAAGKITEQFRELHSETGALTQAEKEHNEGLEKTNQKYEEASQSILKYAKNQEQTKSAQESMKQQLQMIREELNRSNAAFLKQQQQLQTFNSVKSAVVNFMGFNQVLNITRNAVRAAISHIKELDTTMNGIAIVTNMTTADLWKQVDAYSTMAQNFGVTIQGAYEVSKIYYQAGYDSNEVLTLTNETLKLAKISGLDYATTTDYMMTAMRGFKLEMEDASRVVDVYSNLAANTAVSQQELAEAMTRTASSMQSVGATFEETSAMIATMVAVTRESASNIGSAMKSIASRYGELTKDPTKLVDADGEAMAFNKVDAALQSVGISMKTVDGQFRDFTDVIIELAEKWDTLDSTQQRYIATQFAGNRQQSRFLALVSNIELLKENLTNAENSEDIGTLQALKAMDSLESKINQVQVAYQQFYTTIGIEDAWKGFLDQTKNVIDNLNHLPKLFDKIPVAALVVISNLITLIRGILHNAMSNFASILNEALQEAAQNSGAYGERTAQNWVDRLIQKIRNSKNRIAQEQQNAVDNQLKETSQQGNAPQAQKSIFNASKIGNALGGLSAGLTTISVLLDQTTEKGRKASGALMEVGGALKIGSGIAQAFAGNWFGAFVSIASGVVEIFSGIDIFQENAIEKAERLAKEAETAVNEAKKLKAETNTLSSGIEKMKELEEKRHTSVEATEDYKAAVDSLAETFPGLISGFDDAGNAIINIKEAEEYLALQRELSARAAYKAADAERASAQADVEASKIPAIKALNKSQGIGAADRINFLNSLINSAGGNLSDLTYDTNSVKEDARYLNYLNSIIIGRGLSEEDIEDIGEAEKLLSKHTGAIIDKYTSFWNKVNLLDENNDNDTNIKFAHEALIEYQKFATEIEEEDSETAQKIQEAVKYLEEFLEESQQVSVAIYKSNNATKRAIAEYQNIYGYYGSGFENLFAKTLFDSAPNAEWTTEQIKEQEDLFKQFQTEIWDKLTQDSDKQLLTKMVNDSYHYSASDILEKIRSLEINVSEEIEQSIINSYKSTNEDLKVNLTDLLNSTRERKVSTDLWNELRKKVNNEVYEFTEFERKLYNQLFDVSNSYLQVGLESPQLAGLVDLIKDLPPDIQDQILLNGFKTIEGINSSIELIKERNPEIDVSAFETARDGLIQNLSLTIQTITDQFTSEVKDISKKVSQMTSGLDIDEALSLIESSEGLLNLDDFTVVNGKLVTTAETSFRYWQDYLDKMSLKAEVLDGQLSKLDTLIKDQENVEFNKNNKELIGSFLGSENLKKYFDEQGNLIEETSEEFWDALAKAYDNNTKALADLNSARKWASQILKDEENLNNGIYDEFASTREELKDFANKQFGKDNEGLRNRAAQTKLNDAYSNLISDVLSKGFENINLADYEGLWNNGEGINLENTTYVDFVKDYVDFTGKTIEEVNSLIVQAIEKDTAATSGAAQEALAQVDFYTKDIAYASLDTIKKLADAMHVSIDAIKGEYDAGLDQYRLKNVGIWAKDITNSTDILFDSINSVINSITKYINSGLSGKLQGKDITNLNAQLHNYGIKELNTADFIETAEGLKLSEQAAIRLYDELRKIDEIQALITFKDLAKSLQETDEHYKSFSSTLIRIKELNEQINKLSPNNARRQEYERELAVAREIAMVRATTDDKSFKFMDNNLPSVLQNPVNYIDAVGKMFKSINTSTKSGYMEIQDFYNIVNELSNLAALGEPIEFMGQTLDGKMESAAALLDKGFKALSNVDGEGTKVDLSKFGVDFASGADVMNANIEKGIHALAESQVDMLDAMIQLLETVVAMEELGDIDVDENGLFNFDDIFKFSELEDGSKFAIAFTEQWQTAIDALAATDPESDLGKALDSVKIGSHTLREIFSTSFQNLKDLQMNADQYATLMTSLVTWAKSGDYDLDNLYESIKEVFAGSDFTGEISVGDFKIALGYGSYVTFDAKKQKYIDVNGQEHDNANEALLANAMASVKGAESVESLDNGNALVHIKAKGINLSVEIDQSGKRIYRIENLDGEYSSQNDALYALYQQELREPSSKEKVGSFQEFVLGITGDIIPEITVANAETAKKATQEQINNLAQALVSGSTEEVKNAAATIGIEIGVEGELTAEQRKQIAELAGIESKNVALNITANYTGDSAKALGELLEKDPIEIDATVNITDVKDSSGKLSPDENGNITITDLTASGVGDLSISDCTFSIIDGHVHLQKNGVDVFKIPLDQLTASGQGRLSYENCTFTVEGDKAIIKDKDGSLLAAIPLKGVPAAAVGDLLASECTFTYIPGEGFKLSNGTIEVTIPPDKIISSGDILSCTFSYNVGKDTYDIEFPNGNVISIPAGDIEANGKLTKDTVSIKYIGDVPVVSFSGENGELNIPLDAYLKAAGVLTASNCSVTYDGSKLVVLDSENKPITSLSADFTGALIQGVVQQLGLSLGENYSAALNSETGSITISDVIDANGNVGTLTITPDNEDNVYNGQLVAGTVDVGDVGTVKGTSSEANVTAEKYTIKFKSADGKITETLFVKGMADVTANLAKFGIGFNTKDGETSLMNEILASVLMNLSDDAIENLQEQIPDVSVPVTLKPTNVEEVLNNKDLNGAPSYMGGSQSTSPAQIQRDAQQGKSSYTKTTLIAELDVKDAQEKLTSLQEQIKEPQTIKILGDNKDAINKVSTVISYANNADPEITISGDANPAISAAQRAVSDINQMIADIQINATISTSSENGGTGAKGNVALAKGTKTLMGELGPELVVSNGRYFVAGQNGAEFVNLADDAIVFNHLQTRRLLQSGSAGRGKAVVSDKKAVSLATGNTQGPAMASAQAALAALKQLRAMWDALSHASISDLGSKAGLGKSGGGGGKDKDKALKLDAGYIKDLERWYNLLRQIERLEEDINYEEKLRSKHMADTISHGKEIYESYKREYDMLQKEVDRRVELAELKKGYYEQKMQETQEGPWGQLFTFDENGTVQMREGALRILADVFGSDETGAALHSARQQYAMLQGYGFGELMQYKDDGSRIEWTDDEGKPREEAYKEAVEAFSSHMDAYSDELQSLREEYASEMEAILDTQIKQNEILQEIRDNQIAVEEEVMKAIVDSREREIDELKKQRDALADSTDAFIEGLNDQLNKEREMYDQQQNNAELTQMQRQLAILQRSGGSASQIHSLQEQISQRQKEAYFDAQSKAIDAIKEASDRQLQKLDEQIQLMEETLAYEQDHGLLWDKVYEVMNLSEEEIANFITTNQDEWLGKSPAQKEKDLTDLDNKISLWVASKTDISDLGKTMSNALTNGIKAITSVTATRTPYEALPATGDWNPTTTTSKSSGTSGGTGNSGNKGTTSKSTNTTKAATPQYWGWVTYYGPRGEESAKTPISYPTAAQAEAAARELMKTRTGSLKSVFSTTYKKGGLIDYTGPAWVDGTKKRPEGVLSAEQLNMLRNMVLTPKNPLTGLLSDLSNSVGNTASSDTYNSINTNGAIIIENASVNMNVQKISNDYDAKRAMDTAMERMVEIARKSSTTSVRR